MTIDAGILTSTTLTEVLVVTLVADQSADSVILTKIPTGHLVPLNQRLQVNPTSKSQTGTKVSVL